MPTLFKIEPLTGVPPVLLGMTKAESREAMALPFHHYEKVVGSGSFVDAYLEATFQVFFDSSTGMVQAIELSNDTNLRVKLGEFDVFRTPASVLVAAISESAAPALDTENGHSFDFPSLGLWLWRPVVPDSPTDTDGRYFETIGVQVPKGIVAP